MPTRRTPRRRAAPRFVITPEVRAAYARGDDETVRRLLDLKPWEGPTVMDPRHPCVYPPGTGGADWYPHAVELWRLLEGKA